MHSILLSSRPNIGRMQLYHHLNIRCDGGWFVRTGGADVLRSMLDGVGVMFGGCIKGQRESKSCTILWSLASRMMASMCRIDCSDWDHRSRENTFENHVKGFENHRGTRQSRRTDKQHGPMPAGIQEGPRDQNQHVRNPNQRTWRNPGGPVTNTNARRTQIKKRGNLKGEQRPGDQHAVQ